MSTVTAIRRVEELRKFLQEHSGPLLGLQLITFCREANLPSGLEGP
jgi:hypothetical protein